MGCGKSSLLNAILGELNCTGGKVGVYGSVSYHQQQPWILNTSIKENILFGLPYDEAKFKSVIEGSALQPDLNILPAGIETEIGEKGINLSGGQKARYRSYLFSHTHTHTHTISLSLSHFIYIFILLYLYTNLIYL